MATKKTKSPHYGEKTTMISVRVPAGLHKRVQALARTNRLSKSRMVVKILDDATATSETPTAPAMESVFG